MGVFRYSREDGTAAAEYASQVPEAANAERWERVMAVQARVAARRAAAQVGQMVDVLVERVQGPGRLVGRTPAQAPAIDGVVRVAGRAHPGDVVRAQVTGADTYDLHARLICDDPVDRVVPRL